MRLTHINVTMPAGAEDAARAFYGEQLGLREIPKPEPLLARGGAWFDAGGIDLHLSVEEPRGDPDTRRHFGLECENIDEVRARLTVAGAEMDDGRPAPWRRFFVNDPFGNRIEVHEPGALRA